MSTQSSHRSPPASTSHVSEVVSRSVATAVARKCSNRHDVDVTVEGAKRTGADEPLRIRVACPEHGQVTARLIIRHTGGNVYDVHCEVEADASRRFTYSQPRRSGTTLSRAPYLGRKLGAFLVEKLEQHLGRRLMSTSEQPASS